MRIALVVPEFPPETVGGGGAVFAALAEQYRSSAEVRVYSGAGWSGGQKRSTDAVASTGPWAAEVSRYCLVKDPLRRPELRSVMPPRLTSFRLLRRDLEEFGPTVAHVHGFGYPFVDVAAKVLRHRGVPYVFTLHGLPVSPARMIKPVRLAYSVYMHLIASRTHDLACTVTTVSRAVTLPGSPKQAVWIPNGINTTQVDPHAAAQVKGLLGEREADTPLIAAAGRLAYSKGFDVLIQACMLLDCEHATLAIAGDDAGELRGLRRMARGVPAGATVRLLGPLGQREVLALFAAADLVVVPSRSEPFGLVALEAVAAPTRLVVSAVDGLQETFDGSLVRMVRPGDPAALAHAMKDALAAGPLTDLERNDYARILRAHSWQNIGKRYLQLLETCTRRPGPATN